jgi:hypothetical protein
MNISGYKKLCIFEVVEMKNGKKNESEIERKNIGDIKSMYI